MAELLRSRGIFAGYERTDVLRDIDVVVDGRETVVILGANGAGKSTFLRVVMGQLSAREGTISLRDHDLAGMATYDRVRLGIGYVPEGRELFAGMTVADNLEMGAFRASPAAARERLTRVLTLFPKLERLTDTRCQLLSGGEQQMVAIGRALMGDPELLVLDEPSTGLAPRVVSDLYATLTELRRDGLTIVAAEQNARAALRFADRAYVFEGGEISMAAEASTLLEDERLVDAYVGRAQ